MSNYFKTCEKKDCNGCGVCALRCPNEAITMAADNEGFLYPVVDKNKCTKCGFCEKVCSNFNDNEEIEKVYIAINKNEAELKFSSAGGFFYLLAKHIIEKNGVVFGVGYDENLTAVHKYAKNIDACKEFCGSKYVRSDLKNSYRKAEVFLRNDRWVLFTGTPCQVNGLKQYLGTKYDKLILCDILCNANPSPKVFRMYKKNIESKYDKKIKSINFSSKENGWRFSEPVIKFTDGKKITDSVYYKAFKNNLINRPSCSSCVFANKSRVSDFTMGEFLGVEKVDKNIDTFDGVSLITVNTQKAETLLNEINKKVMLEEVDINIAEKYNHLESSLEHKKREKFFSDLSDGKITESNIIDVMGKYNRESFFKELLKKVENFNRKIKKG